jgi:hypothetical protein
VEDVCCNPGCRVLQKSCREQARPDCSGGGVQAAPTLFAKIFELDRNNFFFFLKIFRMNYCSEKMHHVGTFSKLLVRNMN